MKRALISTILFSLLAAITISAGTGTTTPCPKIKIMSPFKGSSSVQVGV